MRRTAGILAGLALTWCIGAVPAAAQDRAVVFIHGVQSNGGTWAEAASRLSAALAISPSLPDVPWRQPYDEQAHSLTHNPSVPWNTSIAVGHSNGGIVARRWARSRPLDAIVTIGSAHEGAPLVNNMGLYGQYTYTAINAMYNAGNAIAYLANTRQNDPYNACCDWWWLASQVFGSLDIGVGFLNYGFVGMLTNLGLQTYVPVMGEMSPYSAFNQDLNWQSSIDWEVSHIPTRVSIISSAPLWGGPFRAGLPDEADWIGWLVHGAAWTLYAIGLDIYFSADWGDHEALDAAYRLMAAANYLDAMDVMWCAAVSVPGMNWCTQNDSVVPAYSQYWRSSIPLYTGDEAGPPHTVLDQTAGGPPGSPAPDVAPQLKWHVDSPGRGTPTSGGDALYFFTATSDVVAVDASTGRLQWKRSLGEPHDGIAGSRLLVTPTNLIAGDYDLIALDPRTGAIRWRYSPVEGYGPGLQLGSFSGGLVLCGSPAGRVYAIDASTGRLRWLAAVAEDRPTTIYRPVSDGRLVFAAYTTFEGFNTGGLVALDLSTGALVWRAAFPRLATSRRPSTAATGGPIIWNGTIVMADAQGTIHGLDAASGVRTWSIPWENEPAALQFQDAVEYRALALAGDTLVASSLSGAIVAYDLRTRTPRWRYYDGRNGSAGFDMAAASGRLFIPFFGGGLVALNVQDGREFWRAPASLSGFAWAPALSGSRIYAVSATEGIHAWEF